MLKNMSAAMAAGAVRRVLGLPSTWHRGMIHNVTFSPDGRHLATLDFNGTVLQLRLGRHLKEDQPSNDR